MEKVILPGWLSAELTEKTDQMINFFFVFNLNTTEVKLN